MCRRVCRIYEILSRSTFYGVSRLRSFKATSRFRSHAGMLWKEQHVMVRSCNVMPSYDIPIMHVCTRRSWRVHWTGVRPAARKNGSGSCESCLSGKRPRNLRRRWILAPTIKEPRYVIPLSTLRHLMVFNPLCSHFASLFLPNSPLPSPLTPFFVNCFPPSCDQVMNDSFRSTGVCLLIGGCRFPAFSVTRPPGREWPRKAKKITTTNLPLQFPEVREAAAVWVP